MKNIVILILFILVPLIGCYNRDTIKEIIPIPVPIELGLVECPECCSSGETDESGFLGFNSCKKCNGAGLMDEVEPGTLETRSKEFIRGYKDFEDGVEEEDFPYMLKIRENKWREGWNRAKELD